MCGLGLCHLLFLVAGKKAIWEFASNDTDADLLFFRQVCKEKGEEGNGDVKKLMEDHNDASLHNDHCDRSALAAWRAFKMSSGAILTMTPRWPALIITSGWFDSSASMTASRRFFVPKGLIPPTR